MSVHVLMQAWPERDLRSISTTAGGLNWTCRQVEAADLTNCLPADFDDVLEQLQRLPRMFAEPDGSWVWVGEQIPHRWQLDGQLHDGPTGLMAMEVKGHAPVASWESLLRTLGWPDHPILFQLIREGIYLDQKEFCTHLRAMQE